MKNVRKALLAAATATAVALSGTAVASAEENGAGAGQSQEQSERQNTDTPDTPAKDPSSSSDFGEVFGSWVPDKETGELEFKFAQALKALKNVAAFGTAIAGVLGVIVTLSTKVPEVLELFGIQTPDKK